MKGKRFIFAKKFEGLPKPSDFELVEEEVPPVKKNEVLYEAVFLSVDPYMRPLSDRMPTGITMFGTQVARVVESKHKDYKAGQYVVGSFGWRTHTVVDPDNVSSPYGGSMKPQVLPDFGQVSLSHALGAVGMPGNTAYFGLTKLCEPKLGETLVVTGAAGAVGSLVGQIGKILGLKVIGFAGTDEKVNMLKEELGFDHAFNYKTKNVTEAIKEAAPNGVDCYFDNVGGTMSSQIMNQMTKFGRVAVCGSIAAYNDDKKEPQQAPVLQPTIVFNELKIEGFIVTRWNKIWNEGITQMLNYMKQNKIICKETVVEGFEKMPDAFIGLFKGDNVGKAVIKV